MQADFIVYAIIPTKEGKEEIRLMPKSNDTPTDLTTTWVLTPAHGLEVGEVVTVGRWPSQS